MDMEAKKRTLRLFSNGVYIMTSRAGDRFGAATVTWLSQASFQPPLIMAAIRKDSNVFRCLSESRIAAVHIVGADQGHIAQKFFAPTRQEPGALSGEPYVDGKTSAPIIQSAPAYVECKVHQIVEDGGDHTVVILEVVNAECREQVEPLTIGRSPWQYGG